MRTLHLCLALTLLAVPACEPLPPESDTVRGDLITIDGSGSGDTFACGGLGQPCCVTGGGCSGSTLGVPLACNADHVCDCPRVVAHYPDGRRIDLGCYSGGGAAYCARSVWFVGMRSVCWAAPALTIYSTPEGGQYVQTALLVSDQMFLSTTARIYDQDASRQQWGAVPVKLLSPYITATPLPASYIRIE